MISQKRIEKFKIWSFYMYGTSFILNILDLLFLHKILISRYDTRLVGGYEVPIPIYSKSSQFILNFEVFIKEMLLVIATILFLIVIIYNLFVFVRKKKSK